MKIYAHGEFWDVPDWANEMSCGGYQNCCVCVACQIRQKRYVQGQVRKHRREARLKRKKEAAMGQRACMGFTSGCHCVRCQEKERHLRRQRTPQNALKASTCQCEDGRAFQGQDTCFKCGRALARAA